MIGEFVSPMLVSEIRKLRLFLNTINTDIVVQPKLDGIRVQIHKKDKEITLFSRSGHVINQSFPEIISQIAKLPQDFIIDGEMIACTPSGKISFNEVMRKYKTGQGDASFYAFDILNINNFDLTQSAYLERRKYLDKIKIKTVQQEIIDNSDDFKKFYIEQLREGFEGIVTRYPYVLYEAGKRSIDVQKIKPFKSIELQVISVEKKNKGFKTYTAQCKEGILAKIPTKLNIPINSIVEVRHDGFIESENYPLGFTLRFPTIFRYRRDLAQPSSVGGAI